MGDSMKKTVFLLSSFTITMSFLGLNAQKQRFELRGLSLHETQMTLATQDPELCSFFSGQRKQAKPSVPYKTQSAKNMIDAFTKERKTPDKLLKALKNQSLLVKFLKDPIPLLKSLQKTQRAWRV
jgi:hypothetical protein